MKNPPKKNIIDQYPDFDMSMLSTDTDDVFRVVQVIPLNEFRFRDFCQKQGITNYLPLRKAWKIHNFTQKGKNYNYSKEVLRPMFPSYVFVRTNEEKLRSLFDSKVIVKFLQPSNQAKFIEEIRAIRMAEMLGINEKLDVHKDIPEGARFLIQSGIWEGVTGWLSKKDDVFKWTVEIEFVDQLVTATIDPSQYKMIRLDE